MPEEEIEGRANEVAHLLVRVCEIHEIIIGENAS
jgi:hypothetical protein